MRKRWDGRVLKKRISRLVRLAVVLNMLALYAWLPRQGSMATDVTENRTSRKKETRRGWCGLGDRERCDAGSVVDDEREMSATRGGDVGADYIWSWRWFASGRRAMISRGNDWT